MIKFRYSSMITSLSQLDLTKEYSYADYLYEANGVREY
jgi:hypothetical protein